MEDVLGYQSPQGPAFVIRCMSRDAYRASAYGGFTAPVAVVADPAIYWYFYCRESDGGDGRCRGC